MKTICAFTIWRAMEDPFHKEKSFEIFDTICTKYDRINRLLSLGRDLSWRKKLLPFIPPSLSAPVLDIATGTADQLSLFLKLPHVKKGVGVDLSFSMLDLGRKKLEKRFPLTRWELLHADAQDLPFADNQFSIASISFGIRNIPDVSKALGQMYRVLQKGGKALILEFSLPENPWIRRAYKSYLKNILPRVGGFLSKSKGSYTYLQKTIEVFPYGSSFLKLMKEANFSRTFSLSFCLGAVSLYVGEK